MKILSLTFIFFVFSLFAINPTEKYLLDFPLEEISQVIENQKAGFRLEDHYSIFEEAIAAEDETFFGYHATTSSHLIYQEIIKAMLEKIFQEKFRDDFYFFRAPGVELFNIKNKNEFFQQFALKPTLDEKTKFIRLYFIQAMEKISQLPFSNFEIDETNLSKVYTALVDPLITDEDLFEVLSEFLNYCYLNEQDFLSYQKALIDWTALPGKFSSIIDLLSEEEVEFILTHLSPYNDTKKAQQQLLISLNIALFAHHTLPSESSLHIFATNSSVDVDFQDKISKELKKFALITGFSPEIVEKCLNLAKDKFDTELGVLLQLFATSKESLDEVSYVCSNFGQPFNQEKVSKYLAAFDPKKFQKMHFPQGVDLILHPQVRLLMTNSEVLNPYSWLIVKKYTSLSNQKIVDFQQELKNLMSEALLDTQQADRFKKNLELQWF